MLDHGKIRTLDAPSQAAAAQWVEVDEPECWSLPTWSQLWSAQRFPHPFSSRDWFLLSRRHFATPDRLRFLVVHEELEPAAFVPLLLDEARGTVRFAGEPELTDYQGPVCRAGAEGATASRLLDWLDAEVTGWSELDGRDLAGAAEFVDALAAEATRRGLLVRRELEREVPVAMPLPRTWQEYLSSLPRKDRHELLRKRRRLALQCPKWIVRRSVGGRVRSDLATFTALHRASIGPKGDFVDSRVEAFWHELARLWAERGWLALHVLEIDGRAVAGTLGFEADASVYLYNAAFDRTAGRLAPGVVLLSEVIRDAIVRGFTRFDFLRGTENYKLRLGGRPERLERLRIFTGG